MNSSIGSPERPPGISGRFTVCVVEMLTTAGITSCTISANEGGVPLAGSAAETRKGTEQQSASASLPSRMAESLFNGGPPSSSDDERTGRRTSCAKDTPYGPDSGIHQAGEGEDV